MVTAGRWQAHLLGAWAWCGRGHRPALLAALGVVVLAQLPYVVGALDPNPLLTVSGLNQGGSQVFPGQTSIDGNAGITSQANGHRAALDWIHGQLPWWNPYEGTGNVLTAAAVSGALFLPFVLLTLLPDGQVPMYLALDLIGAGATFCLLRRLGAQPWACFVAAVLYGLNGTNAWFRYGADNPVAFLPVILLGLEQARDRAIAGRRGGWGLLAVGVAFSLLAGFPETSYVCAVVVVAWLVVRAFGLEGRHVTFVIRSGVGVVAGLLIAAPFVVALADDLQVADLGSHTGTVLGHASLNGNGIISLFSPYALGPIFGFGHAGPAAPTMAAVWGNLGGYLTAATLVLALVGLTGRRHRALRLVLGAVTLVLLGRIFGVAPALDLVNLLPKADTYALYRYSSPAVAMGVVVLCGLAVDDVIARRVPRWVGPAAGVVVLALGAAAAVRADSVHHLLTEADAGTWWVVSLAWAAATAIIVATAVALRHRAATIVLAALVAVEAVAMFAVPELSAPHGVKVDTAAVAFVRSHVGTGRFFSFGGFAPNYGAYYGVPSANISDLPVPRPTATYDLHRLAPDGLIVGFDGVTQGRPGPTPRQELPGHLDGYRDIAVDLLIVPHGTGVGDLPPGAATLEYQDPLLDVYHLAGALPYASVTAGGPCQVDIASRTTITTDCQQPGTLVRRETLVAGWTASRGGHDVTVAGTPSGLQAVAVPAGRTTTRFSFTPPHEGWATAGFVLGLVILAVDGGWVVTRWLRSPDRRLRDGTASV